MPPIAIEPYEPKEFFSASGLALASRCLRAYGFRYLDGEKEPELPYEYFLEPTHIEEAKGLPEFQRMQWYSMRSKALGQAIHAILECYFLGWAKHGTKAERKARRAAAEAIDWTTPHGVIARAMADELPHPSECEEIYTEAEITIDTSGLPALHGKEPINFTGKADLLVKVGGYWTLYDYKSTKSVVNKLEELGYNFVKSSDELREDPQAALYSLHAMQKVGVTNIECAWVYGQTKGKARSAYTKFTIGLARAEKLVNALALQAFSLREVMRSGKKALDLPGNPDACDMMGGCQYHVTRGGRCTVKQSLGDTLIKLTTKTKKKEQDITMGSFAEDLAKAKEEAKKKSSDKKSTAAGDAKGKAAAKSKGKAKDEEEEDEDEEDEEDEEEEEEEKPSKSAKATKKPATKSKGKPREEEDGDPSDAAEREIVYTHTLRKEGYTIMVQGPDEGAVEGIADKIVVEVLND